MSLFLVACLNKSTKKDTPESEKETNNQTKIGMFIDAPVKGLAYTSVPSGKKGTTNEKGEFEYIDGDMVSFSVGSIELGQASPDSAKKVKVTQLKQALLVAQLLQVLDNDVNEDRIDVSDITIPEAVKTAIVEKLQDKDGDANTADIITEDQLEKVKKANPKKMTLQRRVKVVSKEDVLKHVKQQIGTSDLKFSPSELKNLFLIENSLIKKFDGIAIGFSAANSPTSLLYVENNSAAMSKPEWEIDSKGNLVLSVEELECAFSKITEDVDLIDVSYFCNSIEYDAKNSPQDLMRLIKPQPFSANDLSGKSFNFKSLSGKSATLTFGNNGTINCNGEKSSCPYKNHPSYKNAVWIEGGGDNGEDALMILAQGSLAKGKLLMIHYKDDGNTLNSVEVMKVSGNTLMQVFESTDNDHSSDGHNHNTYDNSDSYSKDNSNFDIQNPEYSRFTMAVIAGKTFYNAGNPDDDYGLTVFFGPDNKGQAWFSLTDSTTSPDSTFDYLIDTEGYIIFSNVKEEGYYSDNSPIIGLLQENDNALITCWSDYSASDISDVCMEDDKLVLYKTIDAAKAEIRADFENTHSSINKFIPITEDMISGKTIYAVIPNTEAATKTQITIEFDLSGSGQYQFGYHDNVTSPYTTFDYGIDAQGYLVFSNQVVDGISIPFSVGHGLLQKTDQHLEVCSFVLTPDECGLELWFYNRKDAEEAASK